MSKETEQENTYEQDFNSMFGPKPVENDNEDDTKEVKEEESTELSDSNTDQGTDTDKETEENSSHKSNKSSDNDEVDYDKLLDGVPEDSREQVRMLIQKDKSNRGRLSALQKKVDYAEELRQNAVKNYEELQQRQTAGNQQSPAADTKQESDEGRNKAPEMSKELRAIKEKHPALYNALKEMTTAEAEAVAGKMLEDVNNKLKPVETAQRTQAHKEEALDLEKRVSTLFDTKNTGVGVREAVQSEEFIKWYQGQPTRIQDMYKQAETADDAMLVLSKFALESDYINSIKRNTKESSAGQQQEEKPNNQKGDELRKKREANKKAAVAPSNKTAPTGSDAPSDYNKLFDHFWGKNGVHRKTANRL